MHSSYHLWDFIGTSLENNMGVILMYVLDSNGSSPGRQGFAMAINSAGNLHGSIGGGIMEYKFVEMCRGMFLNPAELKPITRKQFHDKIVTRDQSGMICSGDQTIYIYPLLQKDLIQINQIKKSLFVGEYGKLRLIPGALVFLNEVPSFDYYYSEMEDGNFVYEEKIGYKNRLSIIGGGHCALALSRCMNQMDFYIELYETREELNTVQHNCFIHKAHFIDDYSKLGALVQPGGNHYVVVMTVGYRTDDIVIRALVGRQFKYFGVLGSANKIEKLFSGYIAEGFDENLIRNIHAPIGLPINSRTPEEIAVSIAAEIIRVKNHH